MDRVRFEKKMERKFGKYIIFFYIFYLSYFPMTTCTSCIQGICNCDENTILCLDVINPSFIYRPQISRLYLERVQLLDIKSILNSLPSLRYLAMIDMIYFKCKWMENIPDHITVTGNMCPSSSPIDSKTTVSAG